MRRLSAFQPLARSCLGWQLVDRSGVPVQSMHTCLCVQLGRGLFSRLALDFETGGGLARCDRG